MSGVSVITGDFQDGLWAGWKRFVPRINPRDRSAIGELPYGAFAKPLNQVKLDAQLLLDAIETQSLIPVLEPEAWRNQRLRQDRTPQFNRLGLGDPLHPVDPARFADAPLDWLIRYANPFLSTQWANGAGAILTPSHQAGGRQDPAREGELRFAEFAAQLATANGACERGDHQVPLVIGITVDAAKLGRREDAIKLAESYASMPGDGFWLQLTGLTENAEQEVIDIAGVFMFALQHISRRRVFAVDCKNLIWPLMAAGLSGGCIGVATREQFNGFQKRVEKKRKPGGYQPSVVHQTLLRKFRASHPDAELAFRRYPCDCDAHASHKVPNGNPEISRHDMCIRLAMAAEATGANAINVIHRWLVNADWAAGTLNMTPPPAASYEAAMNAADWRSAAAA